MREVSVIGIGQTPVREHWERSLRELAVESILAALDDARIDRADGLFVASMLAGPLAGQGHLGALLADFAGLRGLEAVAIDTSCGSGGAALHLGYLAVASGLHDIVIVTGVEKMTEEANGPTTSALALAADGDYEAAHGFSFVAINALLMRRYMHEYGVEREAFAGFAINAHRNAVGNPNAMFRREITLEDYRKAKLIAEPISLLDSSPIADGAASIVLCPAEMARRSIGTPVRIRASSVATDTVALHDRRDLLFLEAVRASAQRAYQMAGVTPEDIDLFELHDAFGVIAALSLEASGFAERGRGVRLAEEGEIGLQGRIPICTMGGLKARGHPVGATGVYQAVEVVKQLRGEAGPNQIDCRLGMAQNIGGSGGTVITHILEAAD